MKDHYFQVPTDGDVDQGWALLAVCWSFILCAFITTCLRVVVRKYLTRNLGSDDWNMMIAMTTTLIGGGLITTEVIVGLGRHEYYLEPGQRRLFQALGWADWIQTFITLMFTKISICLFLLRIVETRSIRLIMYGLIGFLVLFTTICCALFLGVCRPLKAYWDVGVDGVCLSDNEIKNVVIAQGVLSIITDLICAAFPMLFLRNLQVKMSTKIALCVLMGLGLITAACCTVRTALSGVLTDYDITWGITTNVGWRLPEVNIGIVCANAPVLRPLYLFWRGRLSSQRTPSTGYTPQRIWPSNARYDKYDGSKTLKRSDAEAVGHEGSSTVPWHSTGSGETSVSMEMGLPIHGKMDEGIV